ncbi:5260_t:CDS:2, partial [Funneliformis geosporum]
MHSCGISIGHIKKKSKFQILFEFPSNVPSSLKAQRAQAIILLKNGFASREITTKVGYESHTTISRLKKKYEKTGKVENKPGSGHPRKLNERDERSLIRLSTNTIRRALKRNSLVAR